VLRIQVLIDILVELLVGTCRFRRVKIASSGDITIGSVEVEGACYGFEILYW
jgi:hypothetical protein